MVMIRSKNNIGRLLLQSLTSIHLKVTAKEQSCNARHIGVLLRRKLEYFLELILELEAPGVVDTRIEKVHIIFKTK